MSLVTLNKLCELTGLDRRAIAPSLEEVPFKVGKNRAHEYDSKIALPAIYGARSANQGDSLHEAKRRDAIASARLKEMAAQRQMKELYPVRDFWTYFLGFYTQVRSRLQALVRSRKMANAELIEFGRVFKETHEKFLREHELPTPWPASVYDMVTASASPRASTSGPARPVVSPLPDESTSRPTPALRQGQTKRLLAGRDSKGATHS